MPTTLPVNALELSGGRARLEPLSPAHAPDLLGAAGEDDLWRYMPVPRPRNLAEMEAIIASALADRDTGSAFPFAVIDRTSGRAVGSTRYLCIEPPNLSVEIGWTWYGASARRTSINTECKYLLMRHAFEAMWPGGANRVQLRTDARNERSRAAILRVGAQFEGVWRKHRVMHDGHVRDSAFYSVVRAEWPGVGARLEGMLLASGILAQRSNNHVDASQTQDH